MIPTHIVPYRNGELRIGWASWDDGSFSDRSIKFAYKDSSGKISRGSPELPFDILVDMIDLALAQNELPRSVQRIERTPDMPESLTNAQLQDERKLLASRLVGLQTMIAEIPWADWQPIYDQIGARYDAVKDELASRP